MEQVSKKLQPSTHCLLRPSDVTRTNVYRHQLICRKQKIGLFSFCIFSVFGSVCLSVLAISRSLFKLGTWNFAEMIMYTYTRNAFFCFSNFRFYNPQPTVYCWGFDLQALLLVLGISKKKRCIISQKIYLISKQKALFCIIARQKCVKIPT